MEVYFVGTLILSVFILMAAIAVKNIPSKEDRAKMRGVSGEQRTGKELNWANRLGAEGFTLFNVYIPMNNGGTTEIDLLYITNIGIFVIESKNYKGWIFGTDTHRIWTEVLYTRKTWSNPRGSEKHTFYNPIMQNKTHINWLKRFVGSDVPMFSMVVFSNECEFKELDLMNTPENVFVLYRREVSPTIFKCFKEYPRVLSDSQAERIYNKLLPLTNPDFAVKEQHKQDVYDKKHGLICPNCGGRLVIRTARSGSNAGSQFYGCSNYPKCRYTRNIRS